jgi:hypothetical protein
VDPGWSVVVMALALSGIARLIAGGFRKREKGILEELAGRPLAPIGKASGAGLRVAGRVQALGDFVTAPVTGRRCVAFELRVEVWRGAGGRTNRWVPILELEDARSFGLADETGDAFVDAGGPFVLALVPDVAGGPGSSDPIDAGRRAVVTSLIGKVHAGWLRGSVPWRYSEGVLDEGDVVSVGGSGVRELNGAGRSPNSRDPPEWLVLRGSDEEPLLISNAPDLRPAG